MWKIFIAIIFCCRIGYAQQNNSYRELIVQVPDLSEWKVYKISKQLACLDGLRFLGYFKERSCLLLHVDLQKITNPEIITTTIHHLNEKLNTEEINGYSIYQILDNQLPLEQKKMTAH